MTDILPGFPVYRLRFRYQAQAYGSLPRNCGSIIRGTLGKAMHDIYCVSNKSICSTCGCRNQCPYSIFWSKENPAHKQFYENYDKYPRSYIVEPPLQHIHLEPGDTFEYNVILMGGAVDEIRAWVAAARLAGELGFGRDRIQMELKEITEANLFGDPGKAIIEIRDKQEIVQPPDPILFNDLMEIFLPDEPVNFLKIKFLSPARLLRDKSPIKDLRFYLLIQSILRRLQMLSELFESETIWQPDFHLYGKLADRIVKYNDETKWLERKRWSASQQKEHDTGGLVNTVIYTGPDIHLFLPILYFAAVVHVGKGTVFGNGRMEIEFI